jgi:threonine synthase
MSVASSTSTPRPAVGPARYRSTRGEADTLGFEQVLLTGLARDGGLYVPEVWPQLSADELRAMRGLPYAEVAWRVMRPFVGGAVADDALRAMLDEAYGQFRHAAVAPLVQLDERHWLLELFHGPTLAFKDVAMQVLGRLYDHVLDRRDERVTLIGATSGDTGSAAIEAFRGRQRAAIVILHPHGRTSEVQRRQMTTVTDDNVHNLAIDGSFDDCQALVKAMFNDAEFRRRVSMSGVNSINWARVLPQVVYYITAGLALGAPDRPVSFSVPTGNFGDVYAGYVAAQMGLPVHRLIVASNVNDILPRTLSTGEHRLGSVVPTMSPSMDIQVSSNFERLLYDLHDRDATAVRGLMDELRASRAFRLKPEVLARAADRFVAERVDEPQTLDAMRRAFEHTGEVLDPHTAVGFAAAERHLGSSDTPDDVAMVTLATAHPAKFPDAVERATGNRPQLPPHLADLYIRDEQFDVLPADLQAVQQHIVTRIV